MKTARMLGAFLALAVIVCNKAYAGNVAVNLKGGIVTSNTLHKPQPKRPFVVPLSVGTPNGVVVTPEANINNTQVRPACWTESCSDAGHLQSGG